MSRAIRYAAAVAVGAVVAGALAVSQPGRVLQSNEARGSDAAARVSAVQARVERLEVTATQLTAQTAALATVARSSPPDAAAPASSPEVSARLAAANASQAAREALDQLPALREFLGLDIDVESNLVSLGGFSPAQASEINTRYEELAAEARALYEEAQAAGRDPYPASIEGLDRAERIMREELGDADYARFRRARRMSTSVHVERVLPGSNAEAAGLLHGDEIISYGGHRVMDLRDLERVAGAAQPGTAVLLEVNRSGQPTFLTASHGVLGVTELNALTRIARERRAMEDSPREYP